MCEKGLVTETKPPMDVEHVNKIHFWIKGYENWNLVDMIKLDGLGFIGGNFWTHLDR